MLFVVSGLTVADAAASLVFLADVVPRFPCASGNVGSWNSVIADGVLAFCLAPKLPRLKGREGVRKPSTGQANNR